MQSTRCSSARSECNDSNMLTNIWGWECLQLLGNMWASLGLNVVLILISYQTWLSINPSYYNYLSQIWLLYLLGLVNLPVCDQETLNLQFQKIFVVRHGAVCSQYYIAPTYSVVDYTDKACKTSDSGPKETLASKPASMQGF